MEKPAGGKRKTQMEGGAAKDEPASAGRGPRRRAHLAEKHSGEPGLSPEDEAHILDAFDASFKDDFEGVPVLGPFQSKKPYECKECGRTFAYSSCLIRHRKRHPRKKRCAGSCPLSTSRCGPAVVSTRAAAAHLLL